MVSCHSLSAAISHFVAGMLATSRGFGDASLKPIVLATPDLFASKRAVDDVAIVSCSSRLLVHLLLIQSQVLCSDGVFDTIENDQIGVVSFSVNIFLCIMHFFHLLSDGSLQVRGSWFQRKS
jgi:serine/threonine protein phosphatase PrpC